MTTIPGGILNALKSTTGEFEVTRVVGAFGGFAYIIGANAFVAWNMIQGHTFDITAYCIAFPSGLGVVVGATAGAVAVKDRNVAQARATEAKTAHDVAGEGPRAVKAAKEKGAEEVSQAAEAEKDKIKESE